MSRSSHQPSHLDGSSNMTLRLLVGKIGRTQILGRIRCRKMFGRSMLCCAWLALAGTSLPTVVAQDVVSEPDFNGGIVVDGNIIDSTGTDGTPMDDSSTNPENDATTEVVGEVFST